MKTVGVLARDKSRDKTYFDKIRNERAESPKRKARIEYARLQLLRKKQLQQWNAMTPEEQSSLRSVRAKAGVKCSKCGRVGFYFELCPSGCFEEAQKKEQAEASDSDEEEEGSPKHPGVAHFWGALPTAASPPPKASLGTLKDQLREETTRLRKTDDPLLPYMFFADGGLGYANNMSELTLHQVLRYIIRMLEREISTNVAGLEANVDVTLFHPPKVKPGQHFYPDSLGKMKEYRDYFADIEATKDRGRKAYMNYASLRPVEASSVYYRGKPGADQSMFEPNPKAGETMHSKIGWKSVLSNSDNLAVADPTMAKQMDKLAKRMKKQSAWTRLQKKDFEYTVDRYAHLAHVVKEELKKEHDREVRLLTAEDGPQLRAMEVKVWKERVEAADRIMDTVMEYEYMNGTGKADFLVFCLSKLKNGILERYSIRKDADDAQSQQSKSKITHSMTSPNAERGAEDDISMISADSASPKTNKVKPVKASTLSRVDQIKQYTKSLKRVPNHTLQQKISDKDLSKKVATNYKQINMQRHIRTGTSSDATNLAPVLIPLHKVLDEKNQDEIPKSHTASQILHELNLQRVDPISGYASRQYVPLYVRSTLMEPNGTSAGGDQMYETLARDRRYSPHIGRSMAALEAPDLHEKFDKAGHRITPRTKKN